MTLTLDEVRKTKFHMARRTGYEVSEVDLFVDRVEASFAQLTEENQALKQQVEALKQANGQARQREDRQEPSTAGSRQQAAAAESKREARPQQAAGSGVGINGIVVTTSAEASPAVVRLVQMATEQSETLVSEATADAKRKVEEANQKANQITTEARTKSERLESESRSTAERVTSEARSTAERITKEARENAQRVTSEAQSRAADVDRQAGERRTQLFAELERERDLLQDAVGQLRSFEANYRQTFTTHLKQQLQAVENISLEPGSKPALAEGAGDKLTKGSSQKGSAQEQGSSQSSTPRLDALLGDNQSTS